MVDKLPLEIKVQVINYLEILDLCFFSLVNKYFYNNLSGYRYLLNSNHSIIVYNDSIKINGISDQTNSDKVILCKTKSILQIMETNLVFVFNSVYLDGSAFAFFNDSLPFALNYHLELVNQVQILWENVSLEFLSQIQLSSLALADSGFINHTNKMKSLKKVTVTGNSNISLQIFQQFLEAIQKTNVKVLKLKNVLLGFTPDFTMISKLESLDLCNCRIRNHQVSALSKALPDSAIKTLDLGSNEISDEGLFSLSNILYKTRLTTLVLSDNEITTNGLKHISNNLQTSQLEELEIADNLINDMSVYFHYFSKSNIKRIYLRNLSRNEEQSLISNLNNSKITFLNIAISHVNLQEFCLALINSKITHLVLDLLGDVNKSMKIISSSIKEAKLTILELETDQNIDTNIIQFFCGLPRNLQNFRLANIQNYTKNIPVVPYIYLKKLELLNANLTDFDLRWLILLINHSDLQIASLLGNEISVPGIQQFACAVKSSVWQILFSKPLDISVEEERCIRSICPSIKLIN
ncbi:hypothetical protein HDV04_000380 [Boothiomyces sp. JEL0838]|nr:hypothetical protein HDV04_000380 [Boothiomyces sp. JEL0838]